MKAKLLDELAWQLDRIVEKHMEENPYGDMERVQQMVAENFTDWLVSKFKEEYYE